LFSLSLIYDIFGKVSAQSISCDVAFGFMAEAASVDETYF